MVTFTSPGVRGRSTSLLGSRFLVLLPVAELSYSHPSTDQPQIRLREFKPLNGKTIASMLTRWLGRPTPAVIPVMWRCVFCFLEQNKECHQSRKEAKSPTPELQPAIRELVRRLVEVSQAADATAPLSRCLWLRRAKKQDVCVCSWSRSTLRWLTSTWGKAAPSADVPPPTRWPTLLWRAKVSHMTRLK